MLSSRAQRGISLRFLQRPLRARTTAVRHKTSASGATEVSPACKRRNSPQTIPSAVGATQARDATPQPRTAATPHPPRPESSERQISREPPPAARTVTSFSILPNPTARLTWAGIGHSNTCQSQSLTVTRGIRLNARDLQNSSLQSHLRTLPAPRIPPHRSRDTNGIALLGFERSKGGYWKLLRLPRWRRILNFLG